MTTPERSRSGRPGRDVRRKKQRAELANTSLVKSLKPTTASGAAVTILATLAVLWIVLAINALLDHRLLRFGIKPRRLDGLPGIALSPFLHANLGHLVANSIPFAVLGWLMLTGGLRSFVWVTTAVVFVAGGIDWSLGPSNSVIVGASGVIFGWLGYLLARAWFGRSVKWIAIAVAVIAVFSSMLGGLLPRLGGNVFWGGHVAGFVVGVAIAALLHRKPKRRVAKPAGSLGI